MFYWMQQCAKKSVDHNKTLSCWQCFVKQILPNYKVHINCIFNFILIELINKYSKISLLNMNNTDLNNMQTVFPGMQVKNHIQTVWRAKITLTVFVTAVTSVKTPIDNTAFFHLHVLYMFLPLSLHVSATSFPVKVTSACKHVVKLTR